MSDVISNSPQGQRPLNGKSNGDEEEAAAAEEEEEEEEEEEKEEENEEKNAKEWDTQISFKIC